MGLYVASGELIGSVVMHTGRWDEWGGTETGAMTDLTGRLGVGARGIGQHQLLYVRHTVDKTPGPTVSSLPLAASPSAALVSVIFVERVSSSLRALSTAASFCREKLVSLSPSLSEGRAG
jgi:hypothetical protein